MHGAIRKVQAFATLPTCAASWCVPLWLVRNPDDEEAQFATDDLTKRLQGELGGEVEDVLEKELTVGDGITALKAHAAREPHQSFVRRSLGDIATLVAEAGIKPNGGGDIGASTTKATGPDVHGTSKRRGRPKDIYVEQREMRLLEVMRDSPQLRGIAYCKALDDGKVTPSIRWITNEKCPKTYVDAYNHPDREQRKKWRKRIQDEKSRIARQTRGKSPDS